MTSVKFSNPIGKTGPNALHTADEVKVLKTVIMPDGRVIQISAGNPNGNPND